MTTKKRASARKHGQSLPRAILADVPYLYLYDSFVMFLACVGGSKNFSNVGDPRDEASHVTSQDRNVPTQSVLGSRSSTNEVKSGWREAKKRK